MMTSDTSPAPREPSPTRDRILAAALREFAAGGLTPPSVRALARAAGVSTGSLQHFFPSQERLREAVDDHVVGLVVAAFATPSTGPEAHRVGEELGRRLTEFTRRHPAASRYLAHRLIEQDPTADRLLDGLVGLAVAQWDQLDQDGHVAAEVDRRWAALHVVIVNIGTLLLGDALDRHLPEPRGTPVGFERWRRAQTELFNGLLTRPRRTTGP